METSFALPSFSFWCRAGRFLEVAIYAASQRERKRIIYREREARARGAARCLHNVHLSKEQREREREGGEEASGGQGVRKSELPSLQPP